MLGKPRLVFWGGASAEAGGFQSSRWSRTIRRLGRRGRLARAFSVLGMRLMLCLAWGIYRHVFPLSEEKYKMKCDSDARMAGPLSASLEERKITTDRIFKGSDHGPCHHILVHPWLKCLSGQSWTQIWTLVEETRRHSRERRNDQGHSP